MQKPVLYGATALAVVVLVGTLAGNLYVRRLGDRAKVRLVRALKDRFDAEVQLSSLALTLLPQPLIVGGGLTIRHRGWPVDHPLILIRKFSATGHLSDLLLQRDEVDQVRLEGMQIHLPPKSRAATEGLTVGNPKAADARLGEDRSHLAIRIREIVADGAFLEVEPAVTGKNPLQFQIQRLTLRSVSSDRPLHFFATLVNAKPPGLIDSAGTFGPWQKDDPRSTAVTGKYIFQNADLSVFRGISGILSSEGSFGGVLQQIDVTGHTHTPDFSLKRGGITVALETDFHAVVNGTDGETLLLPVTARFLHSEFVCNGGVVERDGLHRKTIELHATTNHARIEDILRLVAGGRPLLTGDVDFRTGITIPPGHADVLDKLLLGGRFTIAQGSFTSPALEQRLRMLSDRARGISKMQQADQPPDTVASHFDGRFRLVSGVAQFTQLAFAVPGAEVRLTGEYNLRAQTIDMDGVFRMESTLANSQLGWKHWVLKPLDPLFKKDGAGFEVPLKITGTRDHPEISVVMFHHAFTRK